MTITFMPPEWCADNGIPIVGVCDRSDCPITLLHWHHDVSRNS